MKKKVLSAFVMATVAIGAYAQGYAGTTFNDRIGHGQDSLDVINNFSLYREEFKNQNYKEAYDAWKVVMEKAPLAQIRIYQDGDIICQQLLQKARVHVNPGTMYGTDDPVMGNAGEGYIRINIACPRSQLMEGLRRIYNSVNVKR